jgi:hypothetical protein
MSIWFKSVGESGLPELRELEGALVEYEAVGPPRVC